MTIEVKTRKASDEKIAIGLYKKAFQMSNKEIEERVETIVRNKRAVFNISAGPMIFRGHKYKRFYNDTYVIEIHYKDSYNAHSYELPLNGFGSCLFMDYGEKAQELADDFCEKQGFKFSAQINSWPEFQGIIFR